MVGKKKLKSGSLRLVGERKLAEGELVLISAKAVAQYSRVTNGDALVPTRIMEVNRRGEATRWLYVGKPIHDGEVDEVTAQEIDWYLGIWEN